jgi:hypothetical protein
MQRKFPVEQTLRKIRDISKSLLWIGIYAVALGLLEFGDSFLHTRDNRNIWLVKE